MMTTVRADVRPGIEDLYRDHYRSLVRLASLLVDDLPTCEEVVQDAFVAIHRRGLDGIDPGHVPAYLRSAVLNAARSQLRRRSVRRRLAPVADARQHPSPEQGAVLAEDRRAVLDAVRALPARQQDVIVLRYWLELGEAEIAATLGIAPGTVKTHAKRGLEALAIRLEQNR
jgi:RNA polymerase sigma-70 factor (sigma-E family)